jgi:hypothetical protein
MKTPEPFYLFYYSLLIIGSIFSLLCYRKGDKKAVYIILLLIGTLFIENIRVFLIQEKIKSAYLVNVFAGIEYSLFCFYYLKACMQKRAAIWVKISITLFLLFSFTNAFLIYRFGEPYNRLITWNINVEGFLLFIIYTHLLFNIDDDVPFPIYKHPDFWIAIGVLIFYGSVFVTLGLYPILIKIDAAKAGFNYAVILRSFNVILYLCIIGGSLCFLKHRKYLIR